MSPRPAPDAPAPPPATCRGAHLLCELHDVRPEHLRDADHIAEALRAVARRCGARVLAVRLHPFAENGGVTGVALLAESHVTIHTWPEHTYAAVDVFLCGGRDPRRSLPVFERAFAPGRIEHRVIERGTGARVEE